jgi:hypothetical protein
VGGWQEGGKPERVERRSQIDVGSPVPPESPSMNPETGRFSATYVMNVTKVAENQNGIVLFNKISLLFCQFDQFLYTLIADSESSGIGSTTWNPPKIFS